GAGTAGPRAARVYRRRLAPRPASRRWRVSFRLSAPGEWAARLQVLPRWTSLEAAPAVPRVAGLARRAAPSRGRTGPVQWPGVAVRATTRGDRPGSTGVDDQACARQSHATATCASGEAGRRGANPPRPETRAAVADRSRFDGGARAAPCARNPPRARHRARVVSDPLSIFRAIQPDAR